MNLYHGGGLDKLARTGDLRKEKPRDDDLRAALVMRCRACKRPLLRPLPMRACKRR